MNEKEFKQIKEKIMSDKIEEKERLLKEISKHEKRNSHYHKEYCDVQSSEYNSFDYEKGKYYRIVQIPFTEEEYETFKIIDEEIDKLKEKKSKLINGKTSDNIRRWSKIVFWIISISSLFILTPLAFYFQRLLEGYAIIVQNNENQIEENNKK